MKKMTAIKITAAALALLLSACGFHLRGSLLWPENARDIDLELAEKTSPFGEQLQKALTRQQVSINTDANWELQVTALKRERRTAALGSDALAAEYQLILSTTFSLRNKVSDTVLLADEPLSLIRNYQFDENQVLAADSEAGKLEEEMRTELVFLLLQRVSFTLKNQPNSVNHGAPQS